MHVRDNFLQDKALLKTLADEGLWRDALGKYFWWDGWWRRDAHNVWERLAQAIWQPQAVEGKIAGFEYWVNIIDADGPDNYLGWHRDKDERRVREKNEIACPLVGTVFYGFPHRIEGGYLEISADDSFSEIERLRPLHNRLVILDVSQFHRVTKIYSGKRMGLQVNLWKDKPETFRDSDVVTTAFHDQAPPPGAPTMAAPGV